jgi:hypothetical protein
MFFIWSIISIIGALVTAPTPQSHTLAIFATISFSTYCIISEIQKNKRHR